MQASQHNLYKIRCTATNNVVGMITEENVAKAVRKYARNGGECVKIKAEKISCGYPQETCIIYE